MLERDSTVDADDELKIDSTVTLKAAPQPKNKTVIPINPIAAAETLITIPPLNAILKAF